MTRCKKTGCLRLLKTGQLCRVIEFVNVKKIRHALHGLIFFTGSFTKKWSLWRQPGTLSLPRIHRLDAGTSTNWHGQQVVWRSLVKNFPLFFGRCLTYMWLQATDSLAVQHGGNSVPTSYRGPCLHISVFWSQDIGQHESSLVIKFQVDIQTVP